MSLLADVEAALAAAEIDPRDVAAARLAREYAAAIDALDDESRPKLIGTIGPSLLKCLEALGLTPASRKDAPAAPPVTGALAALRSVK